METILQDIRDRVSEVPTSLTSTSEAFKGLEMGVQLAPLSRTLRLSNREVFIRLAAMAAAGAAIAELEDAEEEAQDK